MLTVSRLARLCGLSRTTVLYYESIGLLTPARRGAGRYRAYSEPDISRLRQICAWRHAGLKLDDIQTILCPGQPARRENDISAVLKRRLMELEAEIEAKRNQQKSILLLLREKETQMTKEKWTSIMSAAGLFRRGYAPLARRVRASGAGRPSGVPRIPAHSGNGN
jgi:DNA-binding transcriptional MerR regulator